MQLDEGMDTGPRSRAPRRDRSRRDLRQRSSRGSRRSAPSRCSNAIAAIAAGTARTPQDHAAATHAPMLAKVRWCRSTSRSPRTWSPRASAASIRGRAPKRRLRGHDGEAVPRALLTSLAAQRGRAPGHGRLAIDAARPSHVACAEGCRRDPRDPGAPAGSAMTAQESALVAASPYKCRRRLSLPAPGAAVAMTARELARRVLERVERDARGDAGARRRARARRASTSAIGGSPRSSSTACCDTGRASIARSWRHADLIARRRRCDRRCASPRTSCCSSIACRRYAAVDDAVAAARARRRAKLAGFANAVLRSIGRAQRRGQRTEPPPPAGDLGQTARPPRSDALDPRWILDELTASTRDATDRPARVTELAALRQRVRRDDRAQRSPHGARCARRRATSPAAARCRLHVWPLPLPLPGRCRCR